MDIDEIRDFWNRVAHDWLIQVGTTGDSNRILNSDPVLWSFAGDVTGLDVLDAGCGTGYLSNQLRMRGARVAGVDLSEAMVAIARAQWPDLDFRVDSCSELATIRDSSFDLIVSNYVLMDTPDLEGAIANFHRVLRAGGNAVVVFSHPFFPQGAATASSDGQEVVYRWPSPYFERTKRVDPPWKHFTSEFIWFHRPLSDYWKAFRAAGFTVLDFEEPRNERETRPYSVAFKLAKG